MSDKTTIGRSKQLAAIHIAAKDLGLINGDDRSAYEAMLYSIARVKSASNLDHAGRAQVLDHLRSRGWSTRRSQRSPGAATGRQLGLIRHIWSTLADAGHLDNPTDRGLRAFVQRNTRHLTPSRTGFTTPEFLTSDAASEVIEHLKKWATRLDVDWKQTAA